MHLINVQSCIFLDHHECAKSGGYCRSNALQCDKQNDGRCEDGERCCIPDSGTVKRENIVYTYSSAKASSETLAQINSSAQVICFKTILKRHAFVRSMKDFCN